VAAEELLLMTGVERQVKLAYDNLRSSMLENFEASGAPAEARPIFEKYVDDVMAVLSKALSWENTKSDYLEVFVEEFTEEEIGRLIEFYSTPLGKKSMEVLPELYRKGAEIGKKRYEQVKPDVDKLTARMMDDVAAIQRKPAGDTQHQ
jgi:hypothetical protein